MNELGIDIAQAREWFQHEMDEPYVLIRISNDTADLWASELGNAVRRCYVTDESLEINQQRTKRSLTELISAKLPDPGATMAGDFGEILVYLYQAIQEYPLQVIGPKKWRLKEARTKPAPYSDVVHFVFQSWPVATENDEVLCSEVKTKSTDGVSTPIPSSIEDCQKDRTSRLAKTLAWLHDRALGEDLGELKLEHIERFLKATDHPPAKKRFRAVAVICSSLVNEELNDAPLKASPDYSLVVISVPNLKALYEAVFEAAHSSEISNSVEVN